MNPSSLAHAAARTAKAATVLVLVFLLPGCRRERADGETLRVGVPSTFSSLDPHERTTVAVLSQLSNVYEALTTVDADLALRPGLAVSWRAADPVTWLFELRPDVRFHDGRTLTPADVVFTIRRLRDDPSLRGRSHVAAIAGVEARGPSTVAVTTRSPYSRLPTVLSQVFVVPEGSTREGLTARPNGTGPWAVAAWTPERSLVLSRHEAYWGGRPRFARVEVTLGVGTVAAKAGLRSGNFDVLGLGTADVLSEARGTGRYRVLESPNLFVRFIGFDLRPVSAGAPGRPNPFARAEVREAIDLAIDRPRLARAVSSTAVPTSHIVPPAVFGHDEGALPAAHDPALARQLLAKAGYPKGLDVVLHRPSAFRRAAEELTAQLGEAGIRVTVEMHRSSDFFAALDRGEYGMFIVADGCMTGDALDVLERVFHTADPERGLGASNTTGFRDENVDLLISGVQRLFDPAARKPRLGRLLGLVRQHRAWIPLYHDVDVVVVSNRLEYRSRADGLLRYADVGLASSP